MKRLFRTGKPFEGAGWFWWLGQLFPHTYVTQHGDGKGGLFVCAWNQWLGKVSNVRRWRIQEGS